MSGDKAHGWGLATVVADGEGAGTVLDTWYPRPGLGPLAADDSGGAAWADLVREDPARRVRTELVSREIDLADPPQDAPDAYLRLHLLSHRLVRPRGLNLDGVFGVLTTVVWTSAGPCPVDDFEGTRLRLRSRGLVH